MRKLLYLLLALSIACSPAPEWAGYFSSVDDSVGCTAYDPELQDIAMTRGEALSVTANVLRVPGLFMNAIATTPAEFVDDSTYTVTGRFRKPDDAQNEALDINLQLVRGYVEWHAEIFIGQNPYSDLYRWVWTRQDLDKPIKLFQISDDSEWHTFKMVAEYRSNPTSRVLKSITVDNQTAVINIEMGTNPKAWESSFFLLLETTNMYTACLPAFTHVGKSEWDNVKLVRLDD